MAGMPIIKERECRPLKPSFTAKDIALAPDLLRSAVMRRTLFAALAVLAASPAHAAGVSIAMDEVRTVTFPRSVATIYVGNPTIADINMIDSRHAFVLGKGYGNTNMLALDQDGKQVSNTHISVTARQDASVTLQRGANRVTYSCTSNHCEATPQPGDSKEAFDAASAQITAHESAAKTAANN
jgi:Flp pilus assembly secretin CpaC